MPITRTPIIDDDGSGQTGTVIDNAWKQELYNQIDAFAAVGVAAAWTAYTPTWAILGGGTAPAIGNGTLVASYATVGGLTYFELQLTMGSTTTYGVGNWTLSVPAAKPVIMAGPYRSALIVTGRAYDASVGTSVSLSGAVAISAAGTALPFEFYGAAGSVGPSLPFVWASGDVLNLIGTYRST